jgi:hypothetical protein
VALTGSWLGLRVVQALVGGTGDGATERESEGSAGVVRVLVVGYLKVLLDMMARR